MEPLSAAIATALGLGLILVLKQLVPAEAGIQGDIA